MDVDADSCGDGDTDGNVDDTFGGNAGDSDNYDDDDDGCCC